MKKEKMILRKIKSKTLYRTFEIRKADINVEDRTVALTFSSETPIETWYGIEILDHNPKSVRLKRASKTGLAVKDGHYGDQIGIGRDVSISSDRKGHAIARFGKGVRASEIFQDIQDGIRTGISVGYRIYKMILEKEEKNGPSTYRATDWEPIHIAIVGDPADFSIGIGREKEEEFEIEVLEPKKREEKTMEKCQVCGSEMRDGVCTNAECLTRKQSVQTPAPPVPPVEKTPAVDVKVIAEKATKAEQTRVAEILEIGEKHTCMELASKAIKEGMTREAFVGQVLETKFKAKPIDTPDPNIGMGEGEKKTYRITRAIEAAASGDWSKAGLEREASDAAVKKSGRKAKGSFMIPYDILAQKRDFTLATGAGSNLVATNLMTGSFIEMLRNKMVVQQLGATMLTGLVGDIAIPKQTGATTMYWIADNADITAESNPTIAQVTLSPKTAGAYTDIARSLIQQASMDVENFVQMDLATVLALGLDLACISGTGADNQPTGILNVSGIGAVAIGTDGGAPTWPHIVKLETEISQDNADVGSLAYLTNAKVRGKLKVTEKATNTAQFVWENSKESGMGSLNGYKAAVSNQVPSNLEKGASGAVCSAIIFGNWASLIIGQWSGLDVLVDPYTGSIAGKIRIVLLQSVDLAVRHAQAFSACVDATTT